MGKSVMFEERPAQVWQVGNTFVSRCRFVVWELLARSDVTPQRGMGGRVVIANSHGAQRPPAPPPARWLSTTTELAGGVKQPPAGYFAADAYGVRFSVPANTFMRVFLYRVTARAVRGQGGERVGRLGPRAQDVLLLDGLHEEQVAQGVQVAQDDGQQQRAARKPRQGVREVSARRGSQL